MNFRHTILTIIITALVTGLNAQSLNSVGKAYYKANDLMEEGDTLKAIEKYIECAEKSAAVGELGECIKIKAETRLLEFYLNESIDKLNRNKFEEALAALVMAETYADSIGDPDISSSILDKRLETYIRNGDYYYSRTKYKNAVEMYLTALEIKEESVDAYYGLVLSYIKLDESLKMEEAEKMIRKYSDDAALKQKTRSTIAAYYKKKCKQALADEKYNIVTSMASKNLSYGSKDPEVYYFFAKASNMKEEWAPAENAALKAIQIGGDDLPDYYFELGRAYEGQGKTEKACEAYLQVSTGLNALPAIKRIKELNCE